MTRRWVAIAVGTIVLAVSSRLELIPVPLGTVAYAAGTAAAVTGVVAALLRRTRHHVLWVYGLAGFDLALAVTFLVFVGPGGFAVVLVGAVIPYAFEESGFLADLLAVLAAVAYLGAAVLHGWLIASPRYGIGGVPGLVYLEAAVLVLLLLALRRKPAVLLERIRLAGAAMRRAEGGVLGARAPATRSDDLGLLERSFNRMLEALSGTIAANQREADEAAVLAEVIAQSAQGAVASTDAVAATAAELAKEMAVQRELADGSRRESTDAAREAERLRDRAEGIEMDARRLVDAANLGRERVGRAGETLLAIGEEVRTTAATVQELSHISANIGSFAQRISRIARQTHLLALNAAIEAAHSEGGSEGFAAVADEVRVLAGEAAQSAREVDELIGDVQSRIDAVARAMASGEEKVRDVGVVAVEAQAALDDLHNGVSEIAKLLAATAEVSRTQAGRMAGLAQTMEEVAAISARSAGGADETAGAMASQQSTIADFNAISRQLADLAERVRASLTRFSTDASQGQGEGQGLPPTQRD